jgi:hypothetical protein
MAAPLAFEGAFLELGFVGFDEYKQHLSSTRGAWRTANKTTGHGTPLTGGSATELSATDALLTAGDEASCASQSGNSETIRTSGADRRILTMPLRLRIATYSHAQRPALYPAHDLGRGPCGNVGFGGNRCAGDQEIVAARERTACCFGQHSASPAPNGMLATARLA